MMKMMRRIKTSGRLIMMGDLVPFLVPLWIRRILIMRKYKWQWYLLFWGRGLFLVNEYSFTKHSVNRES